jgi:hypothetical protein
MAGAKFCPPLMMVVMISGYATELAEKLIKEEDYRMQVACGPEI